MIQIEITPNIYDGGCNYNIFVSVYNNGVTNYFDKTFWIKSDSIKFDPNIAGIMSMGLAINIAAIMLDHTEIKIIAKNIKLNKIFTDGIKDMIHERRSCFMDQYKTGEQLKSINIESLLEDIPVIDSVPSSMSCFSFGKESHLTRRLCKEVFDMPYNGGIFIEYAGYARSMWQSKYSDYDDLKVIRSNFNHLTKFINTIDKRYGNIRFNVFMPFIFLACAYSTKSKYIVLGNEWGCTFTNSDKNNDIYYFWDLGEETQHFELLMSILGRSIIKDFRMFSALLPVKEEAIIKLLHDLYPEDYNKLVSCYYPSKSHRWDNVCDKCLTADTKISLLNGTEVPISDLVKDQEYWVYGCKPSGEVIPTKVKALGITRQDNKYCEVTLDNDEVVKCTTDHLFMLRDGTYKRADELIDGESLMPLYRELDEWGYELYLDNLDKRYWYTHQTIGFTYCLNDQECAWINIKYILQDETEKRLVIHHTDFNKRNNEPPNLFWMGFKEHIQYHSDHMSERMTEYWKDSEKIREQADRFSKIVSDLWKDPEYYRVHSEMSSKKMIEQWKDPEFVKNHSKRITDRNIKNWKDFDYFKKFSDMMTKLHKDPEFAKAHLERSSKIMNKLWGDQKFVDKMKIVARLSMTNLNKSGEISRGKIFANFDKLLSLGLDITESNYREFKVSKNSPNILGFFDSYEQAITEYNESREIDIKWNHKVKSVKIVSSEELIDFYDLYSPETSNFALTAGVFVHNCNMYRDVVYTLGLNPPPGLNMNDYKCDIYDVDITNHLSEYAWIPEELRNKIYGFYAKYLLPNSDPNPYTVYGNLAKWIVDETDVVVEEKKY